MGLNWCFICPQGFLPGTPPPLSVNPVQYTIIMLSYTPGGSTSLLSPRLLRRIMVPTPPYIDYLPNSRDVGKGTIGVEYIKIGMNWE